MKRAIAGFHPDTEGDWVADLDCGHRQHVRHRPPFQLRPWVLDDRQREARLGTVLDCPLCDGAEMPEGLRFARRTATWDEQTLPSGLRRAHRLRPGTWGRLVVQEGRLGYRASTTPPIERVLKAGTDQAIPPGVDHEVELSGRAVLFLEFFEVVGHGAPTPRPGGGSGGDTAGGERGEGGDPACWAHLVCLDCGAAPAEGHRRSCPSA